MIARLFPPASMRRLLPDGRRRIAPWIVGLMTFVSLVVGACGLAVLGAAGDLRAASGSRWLLQMPAGPGVARAESLLRGAPGVASVVPVPEADVRRSLATWLGPAGATLDLPVPHLADVTLGRGADGQALAGRLATQIPGARLTAYADELAPLLASLRGISILVIGLLLVLAAGLAAAVTLAARASLDANRATIEVLHGIGATDAQLLGLVQRRIALDALIGGAVGGAAAGLLLLLTLAPARGFLGQFGGRPLLSPADLALLALLPILQAGLATMVARRALAKALRGAP